MMTVRVEVGGHWCRWRHRSRCGHCKTYAPTTCSSTTPATRCGALWKILRTAGVWWHDAACDDREGERQ